MAGKGMEARCHCGRATIQLSRKPDYVNDCNCTICTKLGWTCVYYSSDELEISGQFDGYVRSDLRKAYLEVFRCSHCGVPTHWAPLGEPPFERMGVNAQLLDEALLEGVEVRSIDGRSWDE